MGAARAARALSAPSPGRSDRLRALATTRRPRRLHHPTSGGTVGVDLAGAAMARAQIDTPSWRVALLALAIIGLIAVVGFGAGRLLVVVDQALDPAALH